MLMIMGAISFVAHYRVIKNRRLRLYWQDSETRFYIIILLVGVGLISGYMLLNNQNPATMAYEAISTSTTGGFEIVQYITRDASTFVLNILIILALIGGSSNSAAGGLKAKRILMLLRYVVWKVGKQISPVGTVSHFKYDDKLVATEEVAEVAVYLFIYATAILLVSGFMMAFDYGPSESVLVVTSAQSGGGISPIPGWELVPPVKVALIGTMLFGRLEFMPMFALIAYLLRR
jgi:trk system potassium uptake protein TrkH